MTSPDLKIYTVFYNRGPYLSDTVNSLIKFSGCNTEIIIVDDCSSDSTEEIALELMANNPSVTYFRSDSNAGFTQCLQNAIDATQKSKPSKYIAIHGSGDLCSGYRFDKQVNFLEGNTDFCAVACRHTLQNSSGEDVYTSKFSGEIVRSELVSPPKWTHGTVMYRTKSFFESGGYNPQFKFCQDWDLYTRILNFGRMSVLNDSLYCKKVFTDGATFNPYKRYEQIKYAEVIRLLLNASENERGEAYSHIEKYGLENYLSGKSNQVLKKSIKSFFTLAIAGEYKMSLLWVRIFRENLRLLERLHLELFALVIYLVDSNKVTRFVFRRVILLLRKIL